SNLKTPVFLFQAIQIVIGLMHIGFGIILGLICLTYKNVIFGAFASLAFIGGYPFWRGVSIKGSLGMNLVSAIFALFGLILLLIDVNINGIPNQNYRALSVLAIPNVYATSPLPPWSSSAPPRIDGHSANATNY
ncbi:hypothetical protein HPG69_018980, partial [Diceros bicornis minor]